MLEKKNVRLKRKLLSASMFTGLAAMAATPLLAQDAGDEEDTIIVTGSRLNQANVESSSPVTTIDAELFDIRGTVDTIDLINTLPQAFAAQTTAFANGANGTSTINLRGLGSVRTLVLVDGKRLPFGSPLPGGFSSDVNLIPSQLVERVEIVTGGASAVYGSDAVAGVANFILRKDFEGVEIDGLFGFNQSTNNTELAETALLNFGEDPIQGSVTDNATYDISGIFGANLGDSRGNVTAYFRYLRNDGIQQGDRDFARCALVEASPAPVCGGSNQGPFPTSFVLNPAVALNPDGTPQQIQQFDGGGAAILDDDGNPVFTSVTVPLVDASGSPLAAPVGLTDAAGNPIFDSTGAQIFVPGQAGGSFSLNADDTLSAGLNNAFNFNPFNPIRRSVERFNAGFSSYYEIADNVEAYMDFGFTQSNSPQIIAPSAAFGSSINQVNCDNPLLTAEQLATICGVFTETGLDTDTFNEITGTFGTFARDVDGDGLAQSEVRRRFVEGGNRTDDRTLTNFRILGGFKGTLQDNWQWDVFGQFASTSLSRLQTNQVTSTNLAQSLDIITDPTTGLPACRSAVNGTAPGCLPFVSAFSNGLESDPGLPAFVDTPSLTQGSLQQTVFGGTIQGDLGRYGFKSPFAEEGVSALFGIEYRRDQLQTQGDATNAQGLLVGAGALVLPTNGSTELYEFFLETSIPLVSGAPFAEQLNLTGAYRRSEYESDDLLNGVSGGEFGTNTFSIGLSWVPVEDIRLRGQFQRAIRAPNIGELFLPQNTNLQSLTDPCAGFLPQINPLDQVPTATAAQCANTGLDPSLFGAVPPDSGQLNVITGGNINLTPEVADTFTVGAVIQPRWIDGLTVSIDYYNIDVENVISTIPATSTLNTCLTTGDPLFCTLIDRGTGGSLTQVPRAQAAITAISENIAGLSTSGIDGQIAYSYDIGSWGSLNWNYAATYQFDNVTQNLPSSSPFDCVGSFDAACGNPTFDYRHTLTTTYQTPWNVRASVLWRYFSSVDRLTSVDESTGILTTFTDAGNGDLVSAQFDAESYVDVSVFWDATENVSLRAGVNNVFDNDPPILPTFGPSPTANVEANTVAGVFDAGGRFIFVGVNVRF